MGLLLLLVRLPPSTFLSNRSPVSVLNISLVIVCPGAFSTQLLVARLPERTMFSGLLLSLAFATVFLQFIGIGSAAMFFLSAAPIFVSILLDSLSTGGKGPMSLWAYALGQLSPLLTGTQVICTVFDVFVPLVSTTSNPFPMSSPLLNHAH